MSNEPDERVFNILKSYHPAFPEKTSVADFEYAKNWASKNKISIGTTPEEIATSKELKNEIQKEIEKINAHLGKWEQVKKIELTPEIWTENNGLLTPTLKLKRKVVKERFIKLYEKLYDRV